MISSLPTHLSPTDAEQLRLVQQLNDHALTNTQGFLLYISLLLPLPISWKLAVYHFLLTLPIPTLSPMQITLLAVFAPVVSGLMIILFFVFLVSSIRRGSSPLSLPGIFKKPLEHVFLQVTFPADTTKSSYATEQLYTLLHTVGRQLSFFDKFIKQKKSYSLELVATKQDGIRYIMQIPKEEEELFQRSLLSYLPGIKIQEITDYLVNGLSEIDHIALADVKLTSHPALPLKKQKVLSEFDPIAYLTGNMTKLQENEVIALQIVATPVMSGLHGRILFEMNSLRCKIYKGEPLTGHLNQHTLNTILSLPVISTVWFCVKVVFKIFLGLLKFLLDMITVASSDPKSNTTAFLMAQRMPMNVGQEILNPYEQELQTIVKEKIDQQLFESSIRVLVAGNDDKAIGVRVAGILSSFGQMTSSYQSFQSKGSILPKGMRLKLRLQQFQNRILSQNSVLNQNPILSASELSDLYHFPYADTTKTEDMVKIHSRELPPPLTLKAEGTQDIIFAQNSYGGTTIPIGLTEAERERHLYMIGATGTGKSTMLLSMVNQDLKNGKGLCLIDPHGELAESALSCVPEERISDFIYFNPDDITYPIGLNLLELTPGLDEDELLREKELITESVVSLFRKIFSDMWDAHAHRLEYILRNTLQTALCLENPTIFTVYSLLTDPDFQRKALLKVEDEYLKNFWKNEFGKAGEYQKVKMIGPITARIGRFLFSPSAKRILEQQKSTINFDSILDTKKILICNLSKGKLGEDTAEVLGIMILTKIQLAALKRARKTQKDRQTFHVYVDEFQTFATPSFIQMLSEARKYKVFLTMAEQSTSQQKDKNITNIILANVGTVICFRSANPDDEKLLLPQFSPYVKKNEIMNLPSFHFYMKIAAVKPEEPFSGETVPVVINSDRKKIEELIQASREHFAIKYVKPEKVKQPVKITPTIHEKTEARDGIKPANYLP